MFLLEPQKEPKKVPLLPIAREALRRGCGVAQRSKPQRGFEPHERASSAGWRPSFWPPSALPRNSETFSLPFWSQKGRHKNSMLFYWKGCRRVATLTKRKPKHNRKDKKCKP
nr:MAG TPA: hypothetical protein [Caudoviricetes sp.]